MTNEWISIENQYPEREGFYRCICVGFSNPIKCRFKKAKNGPDEYYPDHFIHKKRVPFVKYWKSKG